MSHSLTVEVLDSDSDPVEGIEVKIGIRLLTGEVTLRERTDSGGHAEFETAGDYDSYQRIYIYVRGQTFGPYEISDGSFTVTLG